MEQNPQGNTNHEKAIRDELPDNWNRVCFLSAFLSKGLKTLVGRGREEQTDDGQNKSDVEDGNVL